MNDAISELKRLLLKRLKGARGQKLRTAQFEPYANDRKRLGVDASQVTAARDELIRDGLVTEAKARGGQSYQLTPAGEQALRTPPLPPPGYDETLLPYHKSYLLYLLLRSDERRASLSDLCTRLNTKQVKGLLGFGYLSTEDRVLVNRALASWILDALTEQGSVTRNESRGYPSYSLTDAGEELLGATDQYESIKFTLTGKQLAELMGAARLAGRGLAEPSEPQEQPTDATPLPSRQLTADRVLAEFERLKKECYAQHGMVPIHELRQAVGEQFGSAAAGHDVLDPLLQELRRQQHIRLVALGDGGIVSQQQIADSIRGENEIYFMIESAQETARVG